MPTRKTKAAMRPMFQVIAADILKRLRYLAPGERLPTETELCEEYGTTRPTVRAAYRLLIDQQAVEKRPRYGYYVRKATARRWQLSQPDSPTFVDPWLAATTNTDETVRQVVTVEMPRSGSRIRGRSLAEMLDLADDAEVICRSALRYVGDGPVEYTSVYAPFSLVMAEPKLARFRDTDDHAGGVEMFDAAGFRIVRFVDSLAARMPTKQESDRLELPDVTPLVDLVRRCFFATPAERCLMVIHSVYRADGVAFEHDIRA